MQDILSADGEQLAIEGDLTDGSLTDGGLVERGAGDQEAAVFAE